MYLHKCKKMKQVSKLLNIRSVQISKTISNIYWVENYSRNHIFLLIKQLYVKKLWQILANIFSDKYLKSYF